MTLRIRALLLQRSSSPSLAAAGALCFRLPRVRRPCGSRWHRRCDDRRPRRHCSTRRTPTVRSWSGLALRQARERATTSRSIRRRSSTARRTALRDYLQREARHRRRPLRRERPAATDARRGRADRRSRVRAAALREHLGPTAATHLTEAALRGMLARSSDPYTVYLSPHEIQGLERIARAAETSAESACTLSVERRPRSLVQPIEAFPPRVPE